MSATPTQQPYDTNPENSSHSHATPRATGDNPDSYAPLAVHASAIDDGPGKPETSAATPTAHAASSVESNPATLATPTAASTAPAPATPARRRMTPRDLVNVGLYTVLYFIVLCIGALGHLVTPALMLVGFGVAIVLDGTIVMLYLAKTPVFGSMTILAGIIGLAMCGHFWATFPIALVLGLIADVIAWSGRYRSRIRNVIAYGVFTLWFVCPYLPIIINSDAYYASLTARMGSDYTHTMQSIFTPGLIIVFALCGALLGMLGAWAGTKLVDKHFAKAGMVA